LHSSKSSVSRIAIEVLKYFRGNPDAADTLEGIARWRLMRKAISETVHETDEAVQWLVGKGFLLEVASPATPRVFRLNPARASEAAVLLETSDPE
jgi:hypothetical protein